MYGFFRVEEGPNKGQHVTVSDGQTIVLGSGDQSIPPLRDRMIAQVHCRVESKDGTFRLTTAHRDAVTFVNGKRIDQCELKSGDVIQLGQTKLTFSYSKMDEESTLEGMALPESLPPQKPEQGS